jgi:hypothetical protein
MRRRDQWLEWIKAVERESETAAVALELLGEALRSNPSLIRHRGLGRRDFVDSALNREATYLVRLFAVFENGLREAWRRAFGKPSHPPIKHIVNAVAAHRHVPLGYQSAVDRVRTYRNSIVHDDSEPAAPTAMREARRFLCRFFSFLPEDW